MESKSRKPFTGDIRFMKEFEEGESVVISGNKFIVDDVQHDSAGSMQVTLLTVDAYLDKWGK